jgi:hypothetical protein
MVRCKERLDTVGGGSNVSRLWVESRIRAAAYQERSIAGKAPRLEVTALAWIDYLSALRTGDRAGRGPERGHDAAQRESWDGGAETKNDN